MMSPPAVWDRVVRTCHWTNAALVILAYQFLEGGGDPHAWAGYAAGSLLLLRMVWGFCGSAPARFVNFFPTPRRIRDCLRGLPGTLHATPGEAVGHNALGALMIFLLLALLALSVVTGWMQASAHWWGEEWVQELHACSTHALVIATGLHVASVLLIERIFGLPLLRAMIGRDTREH